MDVLWTASALRDFEHAVEYIAERRPMAAEKIAEKIYSAAQMLAEQPGMGRPGKVPRTRELVVPGLPFVLPYVVEDGKITIIRVLFAQRKYP